MADSRLLDMLTGYAAAHRHPVNIAVHMLGIPMIMLGSLILLSWISISLMGWPVNAAWMLLLAFFAFYLTLDVIFSLVFLAAGAALAILATTIGELPLATSGPFAAALIIVGYVAQFIGHAIEKSPPVLLKHPVQAQLAAPFFTIVELFKLLGLREELFDEVQRRIASRRRSNGRTLTSG